MSQNTDSKETVTVEMVVCLVSGLLSGSGVSHKDVDGVTDLAIKYAYKIVDAVQKAADAEVARVAQEKVVAEHAKKAAEDKLKHDKKVADEKAAAEKEKLDEEHRAKKQAEKDSENEHHHHKGGK